VTFVFIQGITDDSLRDWKNSIYELASKIDDIDDIPLIDPRRIQQHQLGIFHVKETEARCEVSAAELTRADENNHSWCQDSPMRSWDERAEEAYQWLKGDWGKLPIEPTDYEEARHWRHP
jgi:hypothetical protein